MKGRIIFVGIHNKPGMEPLDSRTKSGKIIDEVIAGLDGPECVKTNLFDANELPEGESLKYLAWDWVNRIKPVHCDVIILLGQGVQAHFVFYSENIVKAAHPASRHHKREEYIANLI
jgi:hypothetical protein